MRRGDFSEVYTGSTALLPELPMVGWSSTSSAGRRGLSAHRHAGTFELCCILGGSVDWWVGSEVHTLTAGSVYITFPGEEHGGVDAVLHPCELIWVQLRPTRAGRLPNLGRRILRRLHSLERRTFEAEETLPEAFRQLVIAHRRSDDMDAITTRARLHILLVQLLRTHDRAQARPPRLSPPVQQAQRIMLRDLASLDRMDHVAVSVGLSVTVFHERFREEVGMTPADWRNRQRIQRARHLLRTTDEPITSIAMRLAYSTSQYFATSFRRHTGMPPGRYRRQCRQSAKAP